MDNEKKSAVITVSRIMAHRGVSTAVLAERTGLSYNTVLAYRRDNTDRLSRQSLEALAACLDVEVWELFFQGEFSRPLVKIAQALGINAEIPITGNEYRAILQQIAEKAGAVIEPADFEPLPKLDTEWV